MVREVRHPGGGIMSETTKQERAIFFSVLEEVAEVIASQSPAGATFSSFFRRLFRDADRLEELETRPNDEIARLQALAENIRGMEPYQPGEASNRPWYDAATIDSLVDTLAPESD